MALRNATTVQFAVDMCLHGLKQVKIGSKLAHATHLGTKDGPVSFFEKGIFDSFLPYPWSQSDPFSRYVGIFGGPKWDATGSNGQNHLFWHPTWSRGKIENGLFFCPRWTLLTHFGNNLFGLELGACCSLVGTGIGV